MKIETQERKRSCFTHDLCTQKAPGFSDVSFMDNLYCRDENWRHSRVPGDVRDVQGTREEGEQRRNGLVSMNVLLWYYPNRWSHVMEDLITSAELSSWEFGIQNLNSCFLLFRIRDSLEEQNSWNKYLTVSQVLIWILRQWLNRIVWRIYYDWKSCQNLHFPRHCFSFWRLLTLNMERML